MRIKTVYACIAQQNRLFAALMGPGCHRTTAASKQRIFRVLFDKR